MSDFPTHTCVSVKCGGCKQPYEDDDLGQIHFDSYDEAVKWVTQMGWKVDGDTARCKSCAASEECERKGHVWDEWWACRCGCHDRVQPTNKVHTQPMQCRCCARCDEMEERTHVDVDG